MNGAVLADVYMPNILSEFRRKKFVLEITKDGEIALFIEDIPFKPILTAFDYIPEDYELNYMSMKNVYDEKLELYWGKLPEHNWERVVPELLREQHKDLKLHELFWKWVPIRKIVDLKCKLRKFYSFNERNTNDNLIFLN